MVILFAGLKSLTSNNEKGQFVVTNEFPMSIC